MLNPAVLSIQSITAGYGDTPALAGISLSLAQGEVLGVVGESGAGKSTLLRAVLGQTQVTAGQILYNGADLASLPPKKRYALLGREITLIAQNPAAAFDPLRSFHSQFRDTLCSHGLWHGTETRRQIISLFQQLDLEGSRRILQSRPREMSGGMIQRIAIALAILLSPQLLLADEPTSALDTEARDAVIEELKNMQIMTNAAILLVTHDLRLAGQLCDKIAVLYAGRLLEYGPAQLVLERPQHPYTMRLIEALPKPGATLPQGLPGDPPQCGPHHIPGCPFAPRCPFALPTCGQSNIILSEKAPGHYSACRKDTTWK